MLAVLPERALWDRPDAAEEIIRRYMPLASRLAGEYARGWESLDDLRQVAYLGLIGAVRRFDPEQGVPFVAFAAITIRGSLKRSFRDNQLLHVPRTLHDHMMELRKIDRRLGGAPIEKLAEEAGITVEEAQEAWMVGVNRFPRSINRPADDGEGGEGTELIETIADPNDAFALVEIRMLLEDFSLDEREATIIHMRFVEDRKQAEIAEVLGISQMHVSRLLRRILARLRARLDGDRLPDSVRL